MAAKMRWTAVVMGFFAAAAIGCPAPKPVAKPDAHGHDHDHAHHGPHGGHVIEIGDEEYHGEWTHDDDGKVTVYLLDKNIKKPVAIPAEKVVVNVKTIAKDKSETLQSYDLAAVNRSEGDMPTASQFEIVDKALLGSLETMAKGAVEASLDVEIEGKKYTASMAEDPHHHH